MTAADLIAFESRIKAKWEAGDLPCLLHLCGGNEEQLIRIFADVKEGDWVFASHRNHSHALLAGIPPERVEALIDAGKSMFVFDRSRNFVTSAILAGTCGIAAGVALALKQSGSNAKVWNFCGDGAEDNGSFAEAVRFAIGCDLPITFVIEDNSRQVDTSYRARWGTDERMDWGPKVRRYHYTATFPHAGSGASFKITFKPEAIERLGRTPLG